MNILKSMMMIDGKGLLSSFSALSGCIWAESGSYEFSQMLEIL